MSLRLWLPMTENLNNYGLDELETASVQTGCTQSDDGKLGKCYKNTSNNSPILTPVSFISKQFTLAAWVRIDTKKNNWNRAVGLYDTNGKNRISLAIENTNGKTLGFNFTGTSTGVTTPAVFDIYPCDMKQGQWVHYAMSYDGIRYYIYEDGVEIANNAADVENAVAEFDSLYLFGGVNNRISQCSLNDVRLYDNVLSIKEIRDLAKGLALHLPLDGPYGAMPNINTWAYSKNPILSLEEGDSVLSVTDHDDFARYTVTTAGTNGGRYDYPCGNSTTLVQGKTYTWSCDIKSSTAFTGNANFKIGFEGGGTITGSDFTCGTEWKRISKTWTQTSSQTFVMYPSGSLANGEWIDIRNLKCEESSVVTPYAPGVNDPDYSVFNAEANKEIDISGCGYNGTKFGNLTLSPDTPKYYCSTVFGAHKGIYCSPHPGQRTNGEPLTVSCWFKQTDRSGYQQIVCNRATYGTYNWMLFMHQTDGSIQLHGFSQNKSTVIPTLNVWHHVAAIVYDNATYSLFLDGEKVIDAVAYNYRSAVVSNYLCIGHYGDSTICNEPFKGQISDVRIYATALSDEDVLELYKTNFKIDTTNKVYSSNFTEV